MSRGRASHKPWIAIGMIVLAVLLIVAYLFLPRRTEPVPEAGVSSVLKKNKTERSEPVDAAKALDVLEPVSAAEPVNAADIVDVPEPVTETQVSTSASVMRTRPRVVEKQIVRPPVYAYDNLETGSEFDRLMKKRLEETGIETSLDMVILSNESFTMGDTTVSMPDVLEKACAQKKKIHETRITEFEQTALEPIHRYGIYVVQPGDNIWDIHFSILKEYYASRGIHVAWDADEPMDTGYSSGVGKILKFSEIMVIIYNVLDEEIVMDIDLIKPLSKLVIYKLDEVFELLSEIEVNQIDQIRFDGTTLWIPAPEA